MKAITAILFVFSTTTTFAASNVAGLISNFHQVDQGIYRGARPQNQTAIAALKEFGIKTVVDLQGGDGNDVWLGSIAKIVEPGEKPEWIKYESETVRNLGMNFVHVPLNSLSDISSVDGKNIFKLLALINDKQNQPVFIHCEHGKDRTGLVIALYRVFYDHWPREQAHDEMIEMGHGLLNQLVTHDMDEYFYKVTVGR